MSQCINPQCLASNLPEAKFCLKCGTTILLQERYRPIKLIGRGGFAKTFLTIDEGKPSQSYCVIKQFLPDNQGSDTIEKAAKMFAQEAVLLEQLGSHEQIPKLLAYFTHAERQYLVQVYIEGRNLSEELAQQGTFTEDSIRSLLQDLLPVLQFAHEKGVIHRDVKPENIIKRSSDQKPVLVDFGAAKYIHLNPVNVTGTIIGSAEYVAPEQARGKPEPSSDLYGLGVTCIHLLTNKSPFDLFDTVDFSWCWRDYLGENRISEELGQIIDKLIQPGTRKRYSQAKEVLAALNSQPINLKNSSQLSSQFSFEVVTVDKMGLIQSSQQTVPYQRLNLYRQVSIDLVEIPAGSFLMGSSFPKGLNNERPQHQVRVPGFLMGQYPVTQPQWNLIASRDDLQVNRKLKVNPAYFKHPHKPVEQVTWLDAVEFCQRLSQLTNREFRLPSEAEWEYACRGGTTTPYCFGEIITPELANYDISTTKTSKSEEREIKQTTPVGEFPANPFGLYDMHGNVWEWCADDWHDNYYYAPTDSSPWITSNLQFNSLAVLRGGSWFDYPLSCRSASRLNTGRGSSQKFIGFRLVSSLY